MTWPVVALAEVAEVRLGRQRSPKNHTGDSMRPYLRAANIGWSGLLLNDVKTMNFTEKEMGVYRLRPGDLLLNEASGSPREVGKPAIWNGEIEGCAIQNTLIRVRPSKRVEPRFLLHFFRNQASSGRFATAARGVGIHHLGADVLSEWPVPLPPLCDQQRLASVLDAADRLRAMRRQSLHKLDDLRQASFVEMFAESGAGLVELAEVAEVQGGLQVTSKRKDHPLEVPYLRVANVHRGLLDLSEIKVLRVTPAELARARLSAGDLLVVEGHGNKDEIGRVAVWDGSVDPCVHQNHLIRVRCDERRLLPRYAEAYLNSHVGRRTLLRAANTTSGLNTISTSDVRGIPLPLPSVISQRRFVVAAEAVDEHIAVMRRSEQHLDTLFAALQQRAFGGEL